MCFAEHLLSNLKALTEKRLGVFIATLGIQVGSDVVVACGCRRMCFTEHLLSNLKALTVQRFGVFIATLIVQVVSDVVVA